MLGLYVSDHPLMGVDAALRRRVDCSISELAEREDGTLLTVGGVVTNLVRKYTKKGEQMAVFVLEDLQDSIEVMVFPRVMLEQGHKLADDNVVTVRGRVDTRDDTPKLIASEITIVEGLDENAAPLRLRLPAAQPRRGPHRAAEGDPAGVPGRLAGLPPHRRQQGAAPGRRVLGRPGAGRARAADGLRSRRRDALGNPCSRQGSLR